MLDWKVFIVCSSKKDINQDYYAKDPTISKKHYTFFNLGKEPFSIDGFEVVNSSEIPGYIRLGRKYAESEVIYNIKKLNLFSDLSHIGLMHYDFDFFDNTSLQTNITEFIDNSLENGIDFVSFFSGFLGHIIGPYNVLFDKRKPNCLFVRDSGLEDPVSINGKIIKDINRILGVELNLKNYDLYSRIALCCSFLAKKEIFDKAGELIVDLIDSHCLDGFDVGDKHRFPGQVAERYIAFFSMLYKKMCFMLDHKFEGGHFDLQNDINAENY